MITYFIGYGLRTNTGVDLNQADRNLFFSDLALLIEQIDGEVLFAGTGSGIWEGVEEPAGAITFIASDDDVTRDYLYSGFRELCRKFEQDSIALSWAQSRLVNADGTVELA